MESTAQLNSNSFVNTLKNSKAEKKVSSYEKFIERLNFSYFGLISMTILVGSIFGGIASSCILSNHAPIWELCLCAAAAMANNTAGIGQAPTKWVFNLFILSTMINILLILVNI